MPSPEPWVESLLPFAWKPPGTAWVVGSPGLVAVRQVYRPLALALAPARDPLAAQAHLHQWSRFLPRAKPPRFWHLHLWD